MNSGPAPDKRENSFGGGRGGRRENSSFGGPRGGRSFDSSNRVYVGNLSWGVDDLSLRELFSEQGKVVDAKVVYDRDSGRSRGFGFVTYSSATEVNNAIDSLNGVVSVILLSLITYLDLCNTHACSQYLLISVVFVLRVSEKNGYKFVHSCSFLHLS